MPKEWFELWFDSPYYHTLYKQHDDQEAQTAIDHLLTVLNLPPGARVLDLACGKGRHSRYLADKGFSVTGLDISAASISYARGFEHDGLEFYQHDMRLPFRMRYFDAVFNFFTSFGYFDNDKDHQLAITNVAKGLRKDGRLMIDFFNSQVVLKNIVPQANKTVDGIEFHLQKKVENGYIVKRIHVQDGPASHRYEERVRAYGLADFEEIFAAAGLRIRATFGDYALSPFVPATSDRLVLWAEKAV
jgi:SAM-dependent methyltransferase